MTKTIAFISTNRSVPWGGSEVLWSMCAQNITQSNEYRAIVYTPKWSDEPLHIQKLGRLGANIIHIPNIKQLSITSRIAIKLKLKRVPDRHTILVHNPSLVIFSLGDHNEAAYEIKQIREANIPYVMIIQLAKEQSIPLDGEKYDVILENYKKATKCYFVSHDNQRIIERQLALHLPNAEVISNPYPFNINADIHFPDTSNGYHLAFVASLSANHKGHDLLFEVLSSNKWKNRDLHINLYGSGPHEQYIPRLIDFYQLKNVHVKGKYSSIEDVWKNNHGSILCSRMEGQSLALLESINYARVPIVTDVGDASLLIEDNVNGFIANSPSVNDIDNALERAWTRRDDWKGMGENVHNKFVTGKHEDPITVFTNKIITLLNH